jgi:hypothetical protein
MHARLLLNLTAAGLLLTISAPWGAAFAQQQSLDGAYRGSLVCEHLPGTTGILRAPLDITIANGTVVAARPIFNHDGSLVVGTEIATGAINAEGPLHLTSSWIAAGAGFKGTYNGTLAAAGGTLTGTEAWTRTPANGGNASRTCFGAFVKLPNMVTPVRAAGPIQGE